MSAEQQVKKFSHYHARNPRIRWHVDIETSSNDGLKMSNNYIAYYSRMFHIASPDHKGFFRTRRLISIHGVEPDEDEQTFMGEDMAGDETELMELLRAVYETGGTLIPTRADCY